MKTSTNQFVRFTEYVIRTLFFLTIFFCFSIQAQQDTITIKLRDYHSSQITSVVSSKLYPYFYTVDLDGKILAYSKETMRVVETIKEPTGYAVKDMRLMYDDRALVLNQKFDFTDGKNDSLISVSIFNQKILKKVPAKFDFIGNQDDVIITKSINTTGQLNIIDVYNLKFESLKRYYSSYKVDMAAYDLENDNVAYVEGILGKQLKVIYQEKNDYKNAVSFDIPETHEIITLFFNDNSLYTIAYNNEKKQIEFINLLDSKGFNTPEFFVTYDYSAFVNVHVSKDDKGLSFAFSVDNSLTIQPLIITKKNNTYKSRFIKVSNGVSKLIKLDSLGKYAMFETFQPNFSSITPLLEYSYSKDKTLRRIPDTERPFYYGTFLPDNNWMVIGRHVKKGSNGLTSYENQIKYYEKGTFSNRFGKLSYNDYLEVKHGITDNSNAAFYIDKTSGIRSFYGSKADSYFDRAYYTYDIINDEVFAISTIDVGKPNIVDYNHKTQKLLVSQRTYYNGGHTDPQEFSIIDRDQERKLDGVYKFGKFSGNGDYLLLISGDNTLTILKTEDLSLIHTETLVDGKYKVFNDLESGFLVTNNYWTIDLEKCNKVSIAYGFNEKGEFTAQKTDCINILDYAATTNITVISIENLGLIVGEKVHKFNASEFPNRISLNKDGTRLMASYTNGIIKVHSLPDMSVLGETIHPDYKSHVFIDANSNYFTNVDPHDYIIATKNSKAIKINALEDRLFNPNKILEIFGEPNQDYLTVLNKALALKKSNKYQNTEVAIKEKPIKTKVKGDLYLLAIGVSDYKQSDFNLTYADKDALDMAKIYGKISKQELNAYKTKFFGKRYKLFNDDDNFKGQINKYIDSYYTTSHIKPLSTDHRYWLESDNGKHYLWDFISESREQINLPNGFKPNPYSTDDRIYINPSNKGFYMITDDNNCYSFSFKTKDYTKVKLPSVLVDKNFENIFFSENNQWLLIDVEYNGLDNAITVKSGTVNSNEIKSYSFNPDIITYMSDKSKTDTLGMYSINIKAISPNGKHLIYTALEDEIFYKNLSNTSALPIKLPLVSKGILDRFSMSNTGKQFSILKNESDIVTYTIENYNTTGELLSKKSFDNTTIGINIFTDSLSYVNGFEPMVQENVFKEDDILSSAIPISFNKTVVKSITNAEATSETISSTLKTFFKKVKPEDQVVIFLAGHGVLDKDFNYYFAPYDMDFNSVGDKGISFSSLINSLKESNSQHKLLLMDSCHSGNTLDVDTKTTSTIRSINSPGQRGAVAQSNSETSDFKLSDVISDLFEDFLSNSGVTVISASSGADVAYENESLGNGAFTSAYISHLKTQLSGSFSGLSENDTKSPVAIRDTDVSELLKQVMLLTKGKQTPDLREFNPKANLKMW